MAHHRGRPKTPLSGRKVVFDNISAVSSTEWAKANSTEFYKIAARLIPSETQLSAEGGPLVVQITRYAAPVQAGSSV